MNTILRRILQSSRRLAHDPNGFARESFIRANSSYKQLEQDFFIQLGRLSTKSWKDQGKTVGWKVFKVRLRYPIQLLTNFYVLCQLVNFAAVCHLFMEFVGAPHAVRLSLCFSYT